MYLYGIWMATRTLAGVCLTFEYIDHYLAIIIIIIIIVTKKEMI